MQSINLSKSFQMIACV